MIARRLSSSNIIDITSITNTLKKMSTTTATTTKNHHYFLQQSNDMLILMIKMLWEVGASSIITTTSSIKNGRSLQTCCSLHSLLLHSSTEPETAARALPAAFILELSVVIEVLLVIATIIVVLILGAISSSETSNSSTNNIIGNFGNMAVLLNLLQDEIKLVKEVRHHFHLESQMFTAERETELNMFNLLEHHTKCYYTAPNPISLIKLKGQESQSVCFIETDKSIS